MIKNILKKSKVLATTLALSLVVGAVPAQNINAEAKETVWVAIDSLDAENESGEGVNTGKVSVEVSSDATAEDAIKAVLEKEKITYTISESEWGDSIDEINGIKTEEIVGKDGSSTWTYWMFLVNGEFASASINATEINDGDVISLVYGDGSVTVPTSMEDDDSLDPSQTEKIAILNKAKEARDILGDFIYNKYFESIYEEVSDKISKDEEIDMSIIPGIEDKYTVYNAYFLAKSGYLTEEMSVLYKLMYEKIASQLEVISKGGETDETLTVTTYGDDGRITTEYKLSIESLTKTATGVDYLAKAALFINAIEEDPTDINGINIFDLATANEMYAASAYLYGAYGREGILLTAITSGDYDMPSGSAVTKEELCKAVAEDVSTQISNDVNYGYGIDGIAMDLVSLGKYKDDEDVSEAVSKGLSYLEMSQAANGGYGNYNSLGVAMTAIGALGVNPLDTDKYDFIKNGNTLFNAVFEYVDVENKIVDEAVGSYAPYQLLDGLDECIKAAEAEMEPVIETEPPTSSAVTPSTDSAVTPTTEPAVTPSDNPDDEDETPAPSATTVPKATPVTTVAPVVKAPATNATVTPSAVTAQKYNTKTFKISKNKVKLKVGKSKTLTYKLKKIDKNADFDEVTYSVKKKYEKNIKVKVNQKKKTIKFKLKKSAKKLKKKTKIKVTFTAGDKTAKVKVIKK